MWRPVKRKTLDSYFRLDSNVLCRREKKKRLLIAAQPFAECRIISKMKTSKWWLLRWECGGGAKRMSRTKSKRNCVCRCCEIRSSLNRQNSHWRQPNEIWLSRMEWNWSKFKWISLPNSTSAERRQVNRCDEFNVRFQEKATHDQEKNEQEAKSNRRNKDTTTSMTRDAQFPLVVVIVRLLNFSNRRFFTFQWFSVREIFTCVDIVATLPFVWQSQNIFLTCNWVDHFCPLRFHLLLYYVVSWLLRWMSLCCHYVDILLENRFHFDDFSSPLKRTHKVVFIVFAWTSTSFALTSISFIWLKSFKTFCLELMTTAAAARHWQCVCLLRCRSFSSLFFFAFVVSLLLFQLMKKNEITFSLLLLPFIRHRVFESNDNFAFSSVIVFFFDFCWIFVLSIRLYIFFFALFSFSPLSRSELLCFFFVCDDNRCFADKRSHFGETLHSLQTIKLVN